MLTKQDIEFMKETRKEIVKNRQTQIIIKYPGEVEYDEISGEITEGETLSRVVLSVVTEISSATGVGTERILINGVEVERGDLWLSISYDLIDDIMTGITEVYYDEKDYVVLATDKKGIGETNRIEVLGRVIT